MYYNQIKVIHGYLLLLLVFMWTHPLGHGSVVLYCRWSQQTPQSTQSYFGTALCGFITKVVKLWSSNQGGQIMWTYNLGGS